MYKNSDFVAGAFVIGAFVIMLWATIVLGGHGGAIIELFTGKKNKTLTIQFDNIAGIVQVDLGLPKFGGNDIKAKRISGGWEIDFIYSFSATAGSNGKQHVWKFKALDNGQVTLLKEAGEPLPAWMKCDVDGKINFASKG